MRLAKAHAAIEKKWVVAIARRGRVRGAVRELVAIAVNEILERITIVELRVFGGGRFASLDVLARCLGRLRRRRHRALRLCLRECRRGRKRREANDFAFEAWEWLRAGEFEVDAICRRSKRSSKGEHILLYPQRACGGVSHDARVDELWGECCRIADCQ